MYGCKIFHVVAVSKFQHSLLQYDEDGNVAGGVIPLVDGGTEGNLIFVINKMMCGVAKCNCSGEFDFLPSTCDSLGLESNQLSCEQMS